MLLDRFWGVSWQVGTAKEECYRIKSNLSNYLNQWISVFLFNVSTRPCRDSFILLLNVEAKSVPKMKSTRPFNTDQTSEFDLRRDRITRLDRLYDSSWQKVQNNSKQESTSKFISTNSQNFMQSWVSFEIPHFKRQQNNRKISLR